MTRELRGAIFLMVVTVGGILACDRTDQPYGAARTDATAPTYAAIADVSGVTGKTFVKDVLPQGDEVPDGKLLFSQSCAACHQLTGQGMPGAFPPLDGSPYVVGDNVDRMASIMLYGLQGPITVKGAQYNSVMAPLGGAFNDAQLAAIATYIRSAWTNKAGEVKADVFTKMRSKWGTRSMFTIQELGEEK